VRGRDGRSTPAHPRREGGSRRGRVRQASFPALADPCLMTQPATMRCGQGLVLFHSVPLECARVSDQLSEKTRSPCFQAPTPRKIHKNHVNLHESSGTCKAMRRQLTGTCSCVSRWREESMARATRLKQNTLSIIKASDMILGWYQPGEPPQRLS
jgi:hypothetical protein